MQYLILSMTISKKWISLHFIPSFFLLLIGLSDVHKFCHPGILSDLNRDFSVFMTLFEICVKVKKNNLVSMLLIVITGKNNISICSEISIFTKTCSICFLFLHKKCKTWGKRPLNYLWHQNVYGLSSYEVASTFFPYKLSHRTNKCQ